jgi:hypothetical protein
VLHSLRSSRSFALVLLGFGLALAATACGTSKASSNAGQSTPTSIRSATLSQDEFLEAFARRTNAHIKVTYDANGESEDYALVVARDGDLWAYSETYRDGSFTVGSAKTLPGRPGTVRATSCENLESKPVCHDRGEVGSLVLQDFVTLLAEESIDRAASVNLLGPITEREIAGREAACMTIDGPKVTQQLTDGSSTGGGTTCIDVQSGLVLSWEPAEATTSLLARKVESPKPSDFRTPVPPS